jgi:hypothetical protein
MPVFRAAAAFGFAEIGDADRARAEAARLTADDLAALPRDPAWSLSLAFLALTCHRLGDSQLAVKLRRSTSRRCARRAARPPSWSRSAPGWSSSSSRPSAPS